MSDEKAARLAAIRAANAARSTNPEAAAVAQPAAQSAPKRPADQFGDMPPAMAPQTLLLILLASAAGALVAAAVLPAWLPQLSDSLIGAEPKAYWYLARASAFVAYGLLWLSMLLGVTMTNKLARIWPGGPIAFDLHQHTSLLGLAFALFHALILIGDRYMSYTLAQILLPFASAGYKPLEVGLGQVGLYLLALVGLSFYARALIGRNMWRAIHFLSFALFGLALLHGITSGSDSHTPFARGLYWFSGGSLLFLTIYRALVAAAPRAARASS